MASLKNIMTGNVKTVHETDTVSEAARRMKEFDIGALPVVEGENVKGVLTDRDIVVRGTADGKNPDETRVSDVMTRDLVYVNDDQSLDDAARLMKENQVRRLIVLDKDKKLSGVFSLGDVVYNQETEEIGKEIEKEVHKPNK